MRIRNSMFKISFSLSLIHLVIGNIVAIYSDNSVVEMIFLPYSFIAGISQFAGWDLTSFLLEIVSLIFMTIIFYPISLFIYKKHIDLHEEN